MRCKVNDEGLGGGLMGRAAVAISVLSTLVLAGCAGVALKPPGPYADLTPQGAVHTDFTGARVRWGGEIIATEPQASHTCFVILALPLYSGGEPHESRDRSLGRFVACSPGFYDPALYARGRLVTIAGTISRFESRKVGGYRYRMPVLEAGAPHLWPIRPQVRYITVPAVPLWQPIYVLPPPPRKP